MTSPIEKAAREAAEAHREEAGRNYFYYTENELCTKQISFEHGFLAGHSSRDAEVAAAAALRSLCDKAIDVLSRYLPPDGIGEQEVINQLLGIFDGPEQRAAFAIHNATSTPDGGKK